MNIQGNLETANENLHTGIQGLCVSWRVNFYFLTCLGSGINLTLLPWKPRRSMKPYVASAVMTSLATCSPLTKKVSSLSGVTIRASLSPFCREGMKKGEKVQGCYFSTRAYAHGKG